MKKSAVGNSLLCTSVTFSKIVMELWSFEVKKCKKGQCVGGPYFAPLKNWSINQSYEENSIFKPINSEVKTPNSQIDNNCNSHKTLVALGNKNPPQINKTSPGRRIPDLSLKTHWSKGGTLQLKSLKTTQIYLIIESTIHLCILLIFYETLFGPSSRIVLA